MKGNTQKPLLEPLHLSQTETSPASMPQLLPFNTEQATPTTHIIKPPTSFEPGMSLAVWKRAMQGFLSTIPAKHRPAFIWNCLSPKANEILAAHGCRTTSDETTIWETLDAAFPEPLGPGEAKMLFWDRKQHTGENANDFANELTILAYKAFPDLTTPERQRLVLECFMRGTTDPNTRFAYLQTPPNTIQEAVSIARRFEFGQHILKLQHPATQPPAPQYTERMRSSTTKEQCYYCARFGQAARTCGHNTRYRGRRYYPNTQPSQSRPSKSPSLFAVDTLNTGGLPFLTLTINSQDVTALIDTGAICSIIHQRLTQGMCYHHLAAHLTTANGSPLRVIGKITLPLSVTGKIGTLTFAIADKIPWEAILGVDFLRKFHCNVDLARLQLTIGNQAIRLSLAASSTTNQQPRPPYTRPNNLEKHLEQLLRDNCKTRDNRSIEKLRTIISQNAAAFAWEGTPQDAPASSGTRSTPGRHHPSAFGRGKFQHTIRHR